MPQKTEAERRSLVRAVEHRADDDGKVTVVGYAAVVGEIADIGGYFHEVLAPGAFTETLKTADVRAYFDHDRGRVLGRKSAGTLRLSEDAKGLAVEIDLPDTSDGRDVRVLIERGDVSGMSFGFVVTRQEWDETGDIPVRTIHEVELHEVSIVSEPAYDGTSIAMRSLEKVRNERQAPHPAHQRIASRRALMEQRFRRIARNPA
ncbi:HK97 family phage prohead protease [Chelatococcus asaccharovorans]|uniref:HK97 family phage prohead protease n=1 Tax=Chelatococcus asaccharovorans TaxID=28210 RepID=UPI00224C642C|nr:HK97 family phage prohead protease [Chelatococcus asaccharovorans]CAH1672016.1 HK97 family phage prohead protease [Chelatococcus asaccharovorans]CAH1676572.1 HK97 family phage prohead protease [Chelatococcus asaccharovorans]